jgi:hypothetical protein
MIVARGDLPAKVSSLLDKLMHSRQIKGSEDEAVPEGLAPEA